MSDPNMEECEKIAKLIIHDPDFDLEKFIGKNLAHVIEAIVANELRFEWRRCKDREIVKKYYKEADADIEPLSTDLRRT